MSIVDSESTTGLEDSDDGVNLPWEPSAGEEVSQQVSSWINPWRPHRRYKESFFGISYMDFMRNVSDIRRASRNRRSQILTGLSIGRSWLDWTYLDTYFTRYFLLCRIIMLTVCF